MEIKQIQKSQIDRNQLLELTQEAVMSKLNCHNIGKILEFDYATQTATIQIQQIKVFKNSYITPTVLTQVPVVIYGSKNAHITMPDLVGTTCILLFMDRNIDNYISTNEMYTPNTTRTHDITDCIALTTFKTLIDKINNYEPNAVNIAYKKIIEEILYDATIKNFGNKIELKANKTENDETTSSIITETSTNITLTSGGKIKLNNSEKNLATLIQSLINTIKNITITEAAVSDSSKMALTSVAAEFSQLLE